MNRKQISISAIVVIALLVIAQVSLAQPSGGPPIGGGGEPGCWPPPCIPIDGGISFLAALGIAFGGKKLLELRGKQS